MVGRMYHHCDSTNDFRRVGWSMPNEWRSLVIVRRLQHNWVLATLAPIAIAFCCYARTNFRVIDGLALQVERIDATRQWTLLFHFDLRVHPNLLRLMTECISETQELLCSAYRHLIQILGCLSHCPIERVSEPSPLKI